MKAVPQGIEPGFVSEVESTRKQLDGHGGVGVEVGQLAIAVDLGFRQPLFTCCGWLTETPETGHGVEQLVVDGGHQRADKPILQGRDFREDRGPALGQRQAFCDRRLDRRDVVDQRRSARADIRMVGRTHAECVQLCCELLALVGDARRQGREFLLARRRHQSGCCRNQGTGPLREAECRLHVRHNVVDALLRITDAAE